METNKKSKNMAKEKRNSLIKNIFIIYGAMFRRYPAAPLMILLYLSVTVAMPFLTTLMPALAIKGITSGNPRMFLIYMTCAVTGFCVLSVLKEVSTAKMSVTHTYTRLGVFLTDFLKKAINTDYLNIEPQPKQKIMGKGVQAISGNNQGAERISIKALDMLVIFLGITIYGTAIFMLDWKIIVVMALMFVADIFLRNNAIKFGDNHREEFSEAGRQIDYLKRNVMNISAGKDIRIFNMKDWFNQRYDELISRNTSFRKRYQLRWYYPTVSAVIFNFARDWIAYALLIHRVLSGQIDVAEFTLYIGIVTGFSDWIYNVSLNMAELRESSHQFNDYYDFMKQKDVFERAVNGNASSGNQVASSESSTAAKKSAPAIEFRNVSFAYEGSTKPVLKGVNFKIRADEKIALVGSNGAGKTTIVKLLCGLYPATGGEILIDGKSINEIGVEKYQDMISVLFQDTTPIAISVAENVCGCAIADVDKARLQECLEKAGLGEKIASLPKKEESFITQTLDENGVVLSGGETQKLLLAKAMYKDGPMLILDEPTSALDPLAESRIYEEYNQLASDKTAVFISHRLASTKFCDRILFLDDGKIAEEGTHDELMAKGGKYREIFDIQSHYYKEGKES